MKAIILSALVAATLAISASAQDYGSLILNHQIAKGMTYEGVVASWGERCGLTYSPDGSEMMEFWMMKNGWVVVFESGRVVSFYDPNAILHGLAIGNPEFARQQEIERQQEIARQQEVERQRKAETAQQSQAQKPTQAQHVAVGSALGNSKP